ncbi:MAG: hypothetical protein QOH35_2658 [Acidobacteriaceae bacterium]|jgi:hypothetical protein|nr:hypothetical protein [Acidobacteriaceae bacterium]MEA2259752.1 hypothetical protein [Acidobacteriaceae bacterium]MEA2541292.1 hypothetical protein [Acidobacteriaceae bacterium]MEA3007408.1 hypothetical protein [Acidobacteriaceae bacterium]
MVEVMDSPDWVGVAPTGEKTFREQTEKQLLGLLSIPVGLKPIPGQKIVFVGESGSRALIVYWVYRTTAEGPTTLSLSGSLWWSGQAVHPLELGQDMPVKMSRGSQPVMATDFAGGIRVRHLDCSP